MYVGLTPSHLKFNERMNGLKAWCKHICKITIVCMCIFNEHKSICSLGCRTPAGIFRREAGEKTGTSSQIPGSVAVQNSCNQVNWEIQCQWHYLKPKFCKQCTGYLASYSGLLTPAPTSTAIYKCWSEKAWVRGYRVAKYSTGFYLPLFLHFGFL